MVEMELIGIRTELPSQAPIVLLRERSPSQRVLPIFIGSPEAIAIAYALEGKPTERPMTHDLFTEVVRELGAELERVVVTQLVDSTFYAELHLRRVGIAGDPAAETEAGGTGDPAGEPDVLVISSRPSDSIALAVRFHCPIFASEEVLDAAGTVLEIEDGDQEAGEEVVEEFRRFIDNVSPEDFQS